jgi:inositol-phosphate phosphatase / L-galactose 1-phosphate phosphatase / histidinol-phosphatase
MTLQRCPDELVAFANQLADYSGAIVKRFFRSPFVVEGKADASPVTIADRKAEQVLRVALAQNRPEDGVIGEEFGVERGDAEYVWVLDPIDGTRAFASGKPMFGTLIALLHDNKPVLGVIDQPVLGERWVGAAGHPTLFNGRECRTRPCLKIEEAVACLGPQAFPFGNATTLDAYRRVAKHARTTSVGGDCYTYGLVASGYIDLVIEHDLKLYDLAALVPVVEGAGGVMTDWHGGRLTRESKGQILAVSNKPLWEQATELLKGAL